MNQVVEEIVREIGKQGAIPFARFMELALYCPVYGYYEKEQDTVGRRGDYYTSVSVGSLFGELLACQFADWLDAEQGSDGDKSIDSPTGEENVGSGNFQIVEAGAHRGELARDILRWLCHHRPEVWARVEYWIVEPSDRRQHWQREVLSEFGKRVHWANNLSELGRLVSASRAAHGSQFGTHTRHSTGVRGVIFSNELLDAMPIHRFGWDAERRAWFEWGVTLRAKEFVWTRMVAAACEVHSPKSSPVDEDAQLVGRRAESENAIGPQLPTMPDDSALSEFALADYVPAELMQVLPEGFTIEVCPAAVAWWRQAADLLGRGRLLAIDYGLPEEEVLRPERIGGTLRAYYRHQSSADVLARPGDQDLTAHVNFAYLRQAGESAGLQTEALATQEQFLTGIGTRIWNGKTGFGEWTPARTRQFQTLTHPEHLGRAFRVLIQSRATGLATAQPRKR